MGICVVSFSSRAGGNCSQIGKLIRSSCKDSQFFDFSSFTVHPCGECGYECFSAPEGQLTWKSVCWTQSYAVTWLISSCRITAIIPAQTSLFSTREASAFFQGRPDLLDAYEKVPKRAVVVSNTNEENFRQALAYQAYKELDILFLPAKEYGKDSNKGDLLTNEKAVSDIIAFVRK